MSTRSPRKMPSWRAMNGERVKMKTPRTPSQLVLLEEYVRLIRFDGCCTTLLCVSKDEIEEEEDVEGKSNRYSSAAVIILYLEFF